MRGIAPGKVILSGEHAVVYGKPALLMAVNRFAESVVTPIRSGAVSVRLADFAISEIIHDDELLRMKEQLRARYVEFCQGKRPIREVLDNPSQLISFVVAGTREFVEAQRLPGLEISVSSDIPIGCGMGSSAATIWSVIFALADFAGIERSRPELYELALEAERLQHGYIGADVCITYHGGCIRFAGGKLVEKLPPPKMRLFLVNTGSPQSSTGECVSAVRERFAKSEIWNDFAAVTDEFQTALMDSKPLRVRELVVANERLLEQIGVVPERVQSFIRRIEVAGGAAKVSGAGAIRGEGSGIVLVFSEQDPKLLCEEYEYLALPFECYTPAEVSPAGMPSDREQRT